MAVHGFAPMPFISAKTVGLVMRLIPSVIPTGKELGHAGYFGWN